MRVNVPLLFAFFTITIHVFTIVHFDVVHHVFFCCYCLLHHCFQEFYETTNKRGEKKQQTNEVKKMIFFFLRKWNIVTVARRNVSTIPPYGVLSTHLYFVLETGYR
jgi:hypothetical protein